MQTYNPSLNGGVARTVRTPTLHTDPAAPLPGTLPKGVARDARGMQSNPRLLRMLEQAVGYQIDRWERSVLFVSGENARTFGGECTYSRGGKPTC